MLHRKYYFHCINDVGPDHAPGDELYGARVLPVSMPGDCIVLHPDMEGQIESIIEHYEVVGLHIGDVVFARTLDEALMEKPLGDRHLDVAFFGQQAHNVIPNRKWFETARLMNGKNGAYKNVFEPLGIKTPAVVLFENAEHFFKSCKELPFPGVNFYKTGGQTSGAGAGVRACKTMDELVVAVKSFPPEDCFQVQAGKQNHDGTIGIPINALFKITDDGVEIVDMSQQDLIECMHNGNFRPTEYESEELWLMVEPAAKLKHQQGFRGPCGFNFIGIDNGNDCIEWWVIECNPRWSGSDYPTAIAKRLGVNAWSAKNYKTKAMLFSELNFQDMLFSGKTKQGIIVFNSGPVSAGFGKVGIMICGERAYRDEIDERLARIL